jgi:multiple sugar transport system permease protein
LTRREHLLLLAPLTLILLLFLIYPAAFGFIASFTDYAPAQLHTHFVGLDNYAEVVGDSEFGATVRNIAAFTLMSVPAELVLGFVMAHLLREPFRGRGLLRVVLLIPWLISPAANGVMWHFMFDRERGLFSFFLAWLGSPGLPSPLGSPNLALPATIISDVWRKAPLVGFLLLPGMLSIPKEQWEQARMEGASVITQIRHIALPWLRPLLLTIALLLIGDTLGTFDNILVLTGGGPGSATMMPGLYSYNEAFRLYNWPVGATSAWMIVAAVVLIGIAYLKLVREQDARVASSHEVLPAQFNSRISVVNQHEDHFDALLGFSDSNGSATATRTPPRRTIGWKAQRRLRNALWALSLSLTVLAFILPVVWTILASFDVKPENVVSPPTWEFVLTLDNYQEIGVTEPGFAQELMTSTDLAVVTTLLTIAVAFFGAYSLARSHLSGKNVLVQSFLILASLPVMAYIIPLNDTVKHLGLYDTFAGVALAETAVLAPLAVYILYGYLVQVSPELEEAARLDGASVWQIIRSVVLPITAAGVAATAVVIFVLSWNQFLVPLVLSTNHVRNIPEAMVDFFKFDRILEWSSVAAAFVASLLPLVILVTAAHRLLEYFSLTPTQQVT